MLFLLFLPAILSCLFLAAHFLRSGDVILVLLALLAGGLLLVRNFWARVGLQVVLALAALEWLRTCDTIMHDRMQEGQPWGRAVAILIGVALFNILAVTLLQMPRSRRWFNRL